MSNIFIAGKAGSGKTLISNYLQKFHGYKSTKMAFGVYDIARNYFGMKEKNRELLQIIGTDAGRDRINRNIWINRLLEDIKIVRYVEEYYCLVPSSFVADDIRFPNEANALLSLGWNGIYLDVPDDVRIKRLTYRDNNPQTIHLSHISETSVDEFKDKLIKIDGTLPIEDVYKQIDKLIFV